MGKLSGKTAVVTGAAKGIGAGNNGRYANPHLDAILDKAAMTLDDGRRAALLATRAE